VNEELEAWERLCEQALIERDPQKRRELATRILEFLEVKQKRLRGDLSLRHN
jgi:hypothetical protein